MNELTNNNIELIEYLQRCIGRIRAYQDVYDIKENDDFIQELRNVIDKNLKLLEKNIIK